MYSIQLLHVLVHVHLLTTSFAVNLESTILSIGDCVTLRLVPVNVTLMPPLLEENKTITSHS